MRISVIVPAYNCEKYLRACLESILSQTYKKLEVILIDDGSTDTSGSICDEFISLDSRIRVIHQANKGVSAARNAGLKAAKGDLISFIDADDTLDLDMYEFLVQLMEAYEADIAHCAYRHIVGEEVRLVHDTKETYLQNQQEALQCLIGSRLFVGSLWNKLYRREVLQGLRFNESLKINEDILYNYYAFKNSKRTVFADVAKYNYIAHKSSSACFVTADLKKNQDSCQVNKEIYYDASSNDLRTTACIRYLRSLSGYFRNCCADNTMKAAREEIRRDIWQLYRDNPHIERNMKVTALLIHYAPWLYRVIYSIHDKVRKPNWEV